MQLECTPANCGEFELCGFEKTLTGFWRCGGTVSHKKHKTLQQNLDNV